MKFLLWKLLGWGVPVCRLYGMSLPGTIAGPWAQQLLTEGRSPWENQAGRGVGTEGEYKTSKSKMKRFKDRVRVGEESREAAGEARSTEKREQRRQIMFCFCTYPETETLRREGRAVPVGLCTGEGSCSGCSTCSASPGKQPTEVQNLCTKLLHLLTIRLTAKSFWVGICLSSLSYLLLGLDFQERTHQANNKGSLILMISLFKGKKGCGHKVPQGHGPYTGRNCTYCHQSRADWSSWVWGLQFFSLFIANTLQKKEKMSIYALWCEKFSLAKGQCCKQWWLRRRAEHTAPRTGLVAGKLC